MRRVVLKMSGEAVADPNGESIISVERLDAFAAEITRATEEIPLQIAIVVGGGNIVRGKTLRGVGRTKADQMGMLSTLINSLAVQDSLTRFGKDSRVMSGLEVNKVAEPFIYGRALRHLDKNRIVILAGGTGNPYSTTDFAAALRANEIGADVLLIAKYGTDGVYDKDPRTSADAEKYSVTTYDELLSKDLQVMDLTAVAICKENQMPIYVFDMESTDAVYESLIGQYEHGTRINGIVSNGDSD